MTSCRTGLGDIFPSRTVGRTRATSLPVTNTTADGSMLLNLHDMIAWNDVVANRRILSERSWDLILDPMTLNSGRSYPYGFGWFLAEAGGQTVQQHGGNWQGFSTQFTRFTGDDLAVDRSGECPQLSGGRIAERDWCAAESVPSPPLHLRRPRSPIQIRRRPNTSEKCWRRSPEGELVLEDFAFIRQTVFPRMRAALTAQLQGPGCTGPHGAAGQASGGRRRLASILGVVRRPALPCARIARAGRGPHCAAPDSGGDTVRAVGRADTCRGSESFDSVRLMFLTLSVIAAGAFATGCTDAAEYDLLLQGGTVVDGTGAPGYVADVAIRGDRIVAIGADLSATRTGHVVDATGLVVAPGFWDNHAHLVTLEEHPDAENFIRQGITTILAPLHSQDQPFPLDAYTARVRMAPNVGLFAGHTWIRKRVMALENRPPTDEELAWMVALVDSSMQQGALGLSTGLEYVPAVFADTDEIVALAEVAAPYGGIYVTHMRDEGVRVLESMGETLEVGRRAGIPVQVNHHKVTGAAHWGLPERTLAMLDSASAAGQEVVHDIYPYTAFSTYSDILFPGWALADGPGAFQSRVNDPATRRRMVSEMRTIFLQQTGSGPESIQFRNCGLTPGDAGTDAGRLPHGARSSDHGERSGRGDDRAAARGWLHRHLRGDGRG